ncbi:MAG: tetratricopeptide repeat protein, partial [Sedimentisphaerales bacterium]|nr:tetratricopeptide repeat protein [Sedimentisphaerales bacterium]
MRQSIIRLAQKLINQMNKNLSEQSASKIGLMVGVLVVITVAAYLPAVRAGFIWDDNDYVYDNWTLRSVEGLRQIWFKIKATPQYYPMVYTSYWLEYRFWELNPAGYHTVNILLHAVGAVLFWRILTILHLPKPGAWLAAAIFALHPVHVESVAWITERKNVLSGVFYLGAALAYLHYALAPENKSGSDTSRMFYIVSLVLFVCALLSKTVTCLLPAVLLLVLWWKRERIGWTDIRGLIPFFVLGITFGLLTAGVEKQHVGAIGEEWNLSFIERCLVAGRALCFYAGKLFWPTSLTFIYPRWNIDTGVWWQYLYPAAAVSVVVVFWLARHRIGRGPVAAVLIFAGTLTLALGFLNFYMMRYTFAADHFQYLASLSLIALVTCCCAAVPLKIWKKCAATAVIVFVLGSLGVLTWRQCHIYKNTETLWRDTLRKNPNSWMAHACLGNALREQGKYDEAISCYFQALQLKPDNADSYYNLGTVSESQGKLDEAIDYYRQALQVQSDYTPAYYNLGAALASKGHLDESIDQYRLALK